MENLLDFKPKHKYFIGIDSDGTAFDSMEIKHKIAFIPTAIKIWGLEKIKEEYTEIAEFINLYSELRGVNRFPGQLLTFDFLVEKKGIDKNILPDYSLLKDFVNSGLPMSNGSLKKFMETNNDEFLTELLKWSEEADEIFTKHAEGLAPFENLREALEIAQNSADIVIISSASSAGLSKDWGEADLLKYVSFVAGQEHGNKSKQLFGTADGKYEKENILMLGDAFGDLDAAKSIGACFYPITPKNEVESWKKFKDKFLVKFLNGEYAGKLEDELAGDFKKILKACN